MTEKKGVKKGVQGKKYMREGMKTGKLLRHDSDTVESAVRV